jgi:hypothetical protein
VELIRMLCVVKIMVSSRFRYGLPIVPVPMVFLFSLAICFQRTQSAFFKERMVIIKLLETQGPEDKC